MNMQLSCYTDTITQFAKVVRHGFHITVDLTVIGITTVFHRINTGVQTMARRCTHGCRIVGTVEFNAVLGYLIDVRSFSVL